MANAQPALEVSSCRTSRPTNSLGPKLRDSCNACAASKVKCDKVKPSCGRCVTRGVRCEYCFAKRSGRQREDRQRDGGRAPQPQSSHMEIPSQTEAQQASSTTAHQASATTPVAALPSPSTHSQSTFDYLNADTDYLFASFTSEDPFTSLWSLKNDIFPPNRRDTESLDLSFLDSNSFTSAPTPLDHFSIRNGVNFEQPSQARMLPFPEDDRSPVALFNSHDGMNGNKNIHNQFNHQSNHQHSPASPRQCSHDCTAQALGHLRQLFPSDSACEDGVEKNRGETTISSVIARNKRSIETISKLLQCFCTEDGYLLLIISMILSKALDRYTAAIRGTASPSSDCQFSNPLSHQSSILRGAFSSDGNDERAEESRVATQLILGELQRVQGLIGLVSQRSDTCGPVNSTAGNSNGNSQGKEVRGNLEGHGVAIFSGVLHQVQDDLRRRVRSLSTEIIDLLRRE